MLMTTKTGPNDARRVVWAISMFFSFFFYPLFLLTIKSRCYCCIVGKEWLREASNNENGPKWTHLALFGPLLSFFFLFISCYIIITVNFRYLPSYLGTEWPPPSLEHPTATATTTTTRDGARTPAAAAAVVAVATAPAATATATVY